MNCDDVRPLLDPLIDDELPANEVRAVQMHLETCVPCRRERDDLLALRTTLQSLGRPAAPPPCARRSSPQSTPRRHRVRGGGTRCTQRSPTRQRLYSAG